jgi:AcrR family transcriptional regulator
MSVKEAPRWRRQPQERPGQIVDAALAEFSARGLEAARMEDIAARAGVSKATIYLYFPGKEELFREVVHRSLTGLKASLGSLEDGATARAALWLLVRVVWDELRSRRFYDVYRLVLSEVNTMPELAREYAREVRRPITAAIRPVLERGVRTGEFVPGEAAVRSRMLMALLVKHALWCARKETVEELKGLTDDEVLEQVMTFFMAALGAAGGDGT